MRILLYIIIVFFMTIFYACEQVIDIELPVHEPRIVVNGHYENGDENFFVYLTDSRPVLDSQNIEPILNAEVLLYENDILIDTMLHFGSGYYSIPLNAPFIVGNRYKVTASAIGFETVTTEQVLLAPINFSIVNYRSEGGVDLEGEVRDEIEIEFDDPVDQQNFYEVVVFRRKKAEPENYRGKYTWSLAPYMEDGWSAPIFNDDFINGKTERLKILTSTMDTSRVTISVKLNAISKDKYLLSKSLVAYGNADGNPFAEPVIVHTNVENGYGLFGVSATNEVILE